MASKDSVPHQQGENGGVKAADDIESNRMQPMSIQTSASAFTTYTPLAWANAAGSSSAPTACVKLLCSPWVLGVLGVTFAALLMILSRSTNSGGVPASTDDDAPSFSQDSSFVPKQLKSETDLLAYYNGNDLSAAFAVGSEQGVVYLAGKMLKKKRAKRPFVLGAIGDGTLVGGLGNCHADGYLPTIANTVTAAFESLGIQFELRQSTFGSFCGSSSMSSASCKNTLLGRDVDLLHFSFPHSSDTQDMRAMLGSLAEGTVHVVESDCSGNAQSLTSGKNAKLLKEYSRFGSDVLCLEDALETVMGEAYKGQAWGRTGDGMHSTARTSSSGLVWRNWLPGPLGHQFLADCTSMLLFRALHAMQSLERDPASSSSTPELLRAPPHCLALHNPHFGEDEITIAQTGSWRKLPGEAAGEDDVPAQNRQEAKCAHPDECGYFEARGSSAGAIVFTIPPQASLPNRKVYICCCCNSELCVDEQFREYVEFKWTTPVTTVSHQEAKHDKTIVAGKECLLVARDMPFANQLSISITQQQVALPVRISKVIAG